MDVNERFADRKLPSAADGRRPRGVRVGGGRVGREEEVGVGEGVMEDRLWRIGRNSNLAVVSQIRDHRVCCSFSPFPMYPKLDFGRAIRNISRYVGPGLGI